jgi:hypothetical protein
MTFAEAGDSCQSCMKFWAKKGKPPRVMEDTGRTTQKGTPIVVCAFCDGDELLKEYHSPYDSD